MSTEHEASGSASARVGGTARWVAWPFLCAANEDEEIRPMSIDEVPPPDPNTPRATPDEAFVKVAELLWEQNKILSGIVRTLPLPDTDSRTFLERLGSQEYAIAVFVGEMHARAKRIL
jgi:hypothetical protein